MLLSACLFLPDVSVASGRTFRATEYLKECGYPPDSQGAFLCNKQVEQARPEMIIAAGTNIRKSCFNAAIPTVLTMANVRVFKQLFMQ